jgi:drug/metabolite transporter (DMT)-like permease
VSSKGHDSLFLHPLSLGLALLTVVLWGGNAVANRYALDTIPPIAVGGLRFGMAALFMVGWCLFERSPLMLKTARHWWAAFVLGVLLYLQISTFQIGLDQSSSSHASLLVNSYIFWVAGWEHFLVRTNRLTWWQLLGLAFAAGGCSALLLSVDTSATTEIRDPVTFQGDLILVLSGFTLAIKIVLTKWAVQGAPVAGTMLWHNVFGTVLFLLTSLLVEDHSTMQLTPVSVSALLYCGFAVSGFCFGANAWLLKRYGASQVSVFSFGSPVFGVILGVMMRGDPVTSWLVASVVLVGLGILLVNLTRPTSPDKE